MFTEMSLNIYLLIPWRRVFDRTGWDGLVRIVLESLPAAVGPGLPPAQSPTPELSPLARWTIALR